MKKYLFIFSLLIAANFIITTHANNLSFFTTQGMVPPPVLRTAEVWACDNYVLPETPYPDYQRAFYTQMSKTTWEVHWLWQKAGVSGEARLLITKGGKLLDVY